jgi:serine/alanine adding enzyme
MAVHIRIMQSAEAPAWDAYVRSHPHATIYHLSAWQSIIRGTYNHKQFYLMALKNEAGPNPETDAIAGILPLIQLKSILFGNQIISIPFFDMGGVLAGESDTEKALIEEAIQMGRRLKIDRLELRQSRPASFPGPCCTQTHKVRMLLDLPESSEALMSGFKSKLRSQIKKAMKDGLKTEIGGVELLDDFYEVFLINMRDLGSPVHSKKLMENLFRHFPIEARIILVRKDGRPLAGSIVIGFKDILENPWASSLRQFSYLNPNMFLYWKVLEYACQCGFKQFDFGRSTPDEGTYKFKAQWGAEPHPLYWQHVTVKGHAVEGGNSGKYKFDMAVKCWKKLPVPVSRYIGPVIRKHIGL